MAPHLVFGAGGIGGTAKSFTFSWDTPEKVNELLSVLQQLDVLELDSAGSYPPGNPWNTETLLGESKAAEKGFIVDSKVAAHVPGPKLSDEAIEASIDKTLRLIGAKKVRTLYAHSPDPSTPLEVTAAAFDRQYRAGKFERLGLSNYSVEDLTTYFNICEEKGYVKPTVYQGLYNAVYREPERALVPFLHKHNCAYYAFSPLAGGFLTGKVTFATENPQANSLERTRWRGESAFQLYGDLFDLPALHQAVRELKVACDAASPPITLQEASLRWILNHSALRDGDAIIIGAKRLDQLESNVAEARGGPLDRAVLAAVENMWTIAEGSGTPTISELMAKRQPKA